MLLNASSNAPKSQAAGAPPAAAAAASDPRARQFEARLAFNISPPAGGAGAARAGRFNFTAGARLLLGGASYADVLLRGTAEAGVAGAPQQWMRVTGLSVVVDKTHAGGFTPAALEGGPVPLPAGNSRGWWLPGQALALDLWVDHNLLEVYAMGGLARVTSRIYPADGRSAWGLAALGSAVPAGAGVVKLARADVWSLDNAFAGQPPLC